MGNEFKPSSNKKESPPLGRQTMLKPVNLYKKLTQIWISYKIYKLRGERKVSILGFRDGLEDVCIYLIVFYIDALDSFFLSLKKNNKELFYDLELTFCKCAFY